MVLFYIKVLSYNAKVWYPWSYRYLGQGCSYDEDMLLYAKSFNSKEKAEDFIKEIFKGE